MNLYDRLPLFIGHVLNNRVPRITRIVDDDVESAKCLSGRFYHAVRELDIGHAAGAHHRSTARLSYFLCSRLSNIPVYVIDHNRGAMVGEQHRDGLTDSSPRPGDDS